MNAKLKYGLTYLGGLIGAALRFTGVLAGGVSVFLIIAPVFGYLAYSDRPGPGWFGSFPAISFSEFVANAAAMIPNGLFLAILLLLPALLCALTVRVAELFPIPLRAVQVIGGLAGGVIGAYWMLGAGWYLAAGEAMFWLALALGVYAGVATMPRKHRLRRAAA